MNVRRASGIGVFAVIVLSVAASAAPARLKKGLVGDIEQQTRTNPDYRRVLYTGKNMQLVLMTLRPGEEIGSEAHARTDQFFRFETGTGEIWIDGQRTAVKGGMAALVPAGAQHNVKNTGNEPLTLYTIYAPPQHQDGLVAPTKSEADRSSERFTGKTTEP